MTAILERPAAETPPAAPPAPKIPTTQRDGFLDTVRAIALVRVIIWHTLAWVAISWFVASMPAMFFVAGSLLARALDKGQLRKLFVTRLRRLLLPFWTFAAVVLSALLIVYRLNPGADTAISPLSLLAWIFPITDPHGSAWEAGWASTPLWYLRCYLWLLLLSPLMRRAHRRWGLRVLIVPVLGVFAVDLLMRHPELAPAAFAHIQYYAGDLACFSFFWMLGFSHSDGAIATLDRRARLEWAAIGGAAAVVWVKLVQPSDLIVNDHYPLLMFVGIAWLALFLAFEKWIGRATQHGWFGPVVRWMGRRSITIYLWHPIAIVGAYWLRATFFPTVPAVAILPVVFALTFALSVLFGRVEDYSAGRRAEWWPGRPDGVRIRALGDRFGRYLPRQLSPVRALVIGGVVGALVLNVLVPTSAAVAPTTTDTAAGSADTGDGLALPPAPSAKPQQADFGTDTATDNATASAPTSTTAAAPTATAATDAAALTPTVQAAVDAWRTAKKVDGVELGVMQADGSVVTVTSGTQTGGGTLDLAANFPITSITKTMTASMILQLVKDGKIGLDDMLPEITAVPGLPYVGKVTIAQILNHTAGILPYDKSPAYETAKTGPLTAETALALIKDQPLEWTPGSQVGYSNSGYLTLGLLAEQLTGEQYVNLLQQRIFDAAGMTASTLDTVPTAGWAGFSAGGVKSTIADMLAYGDALYRKGKILDADSLGQMLDINNEFNTGLGAFPYCPCATENGVKVYSSIGHNGGSTTLQYAPKQNLIIAVNLTESLWTDQLSQADVAELLTAVEAAAG